MSSVESNSSKRAIHVSVVGDGTESFAAATLSAEGLPRDDERTVISKNPPLAPAVLPSAAAPGELRTLLVGETLDHYELQEFIGGGGMGAVFRALDTQLDRFVALKVLARDQSKDDETLRRFRNEAQSAARLDHENIARAFGLGEDKGLHYIAFEYIEGINIRALVERKGALPIHEAISYTLQIAEALAHAHSRDVVHRDIKPSNVLITSEGRAKLVDMGLARVRRGDQAGDDLTASGVTLGTFDYISPEQARDPRNADVRSDIYSLGCTLYYMLTARPPFPEGTVLQKLLDHQGNTPADPRQFNPDLPDELCRIISRMLAKDPKHRYQRPGELLAEMVLLADDLGWRPHGTDRLAWLAPSSSPATFLDQHLPWMAPLGTLIAVVLVLHVLWNSPSGLEEVSERPQIPTRQVSNPQAASTLASNDIKQPVDKRRAASNGGNEKNGGRPATASPATAAAKGDADPKNGAGAAKPTEVANDKDREVRSNRIDEVPSLSNEPAATKSIPVASTDEPNDDAEETASDQDDAPAAEVASTNKNTSGNSANNTDDPKVTPRVTEPAATRPGSADSVAAASVPSGFVIIGASSQAEREFNTLRAACQAAKSGDVIELRFNGRREEPKPIRLDNLRVTIRAGETFKPVISFKPNEVDPLKYPRSMLLVSGGQVTLINVALELDVPRQIPADRWALLELQRAELVRLERCSLTIRNSSDKRQAFHSGVAFFDVTAPAGDGMMMDDTPPSVMPATSVAVQMQHCVVRGEAALLSSRDQQPFNLLWENGLLVTTESLYSSHARAMPARQPGLARIDLRHITARADAGLCRTFSADSARFLLPIELDCSNSIIMIDPNSALIQQLGVDTSLDYRKTFNWNGNRNLYDQFSVFWRTIPLNAQEPANDWTAAKWQAFWTDSRESAPSWGPVVWKNAPSPQLACHALAPTDFLLEHKVGGNPARGAGSDGRDLGLEPDLLISVPLFAETNSRSDP